MYQNVFFIVPAHIMMLPGMTLHYLRFYETIFQFWNHKQPCFLSNKMIMDRTGIKSLSTINEAFTYFEKHGELKRVQKGDKRYLMQPTNALELPVDNFDKSCTNTGQTIDPEIGGVSVEREGGYRYTERGGIATPIHNINKLKKKNMKKREKPSLDNFCTDQKTTLSDKYQPSDAVSAYAIQNNIDAATAKKVEAKFRAYYTSGEGKNTRSDNWDQRLISWLANERPSKPTPPTALRTNETKSSVPWGINGDPLKGAIAPAPTKPKAEPKEEHKSYTIEEKNVAHETLNDIFKALGRKPRRVLDELRENGQGQEGNKTKGRDRSGTRTAASYLGF